MQRYNFYYRQKVLEDELDNAFNACEVADRALSTDLDLVARTPPDEKSKYGGVMWGFGATNPSSLDISIASGVAYDELGQRIYTSQPYTVTVTNEGDVESAGETVIGNGGTPAGASTDPGNGNSVWVSVYVAFARLNSQERFDGYNASVWFDNAESFYFHVVKGTVKATGSLLETDKPARLSNKVLITDIKLTNAGSVAVDGSPDVTRTEWYLNIATTTGLQTSITQKGNPRDAIMAMLSLYNDHASGLADKHKAAQIIFDTGSLGTTWADTNAGTYGGSTTVLAALTNLVTDLKATATANSGAIRLGAKAQSGSAGTIAYTSPANLAAGTLEAQLTELLTAVNGRVFRGGDSGIGGALVPAANGTALGADGGNNWDVYMRDFKISGWAKSGIAPDVTDSYMLGIAGKIWNEIHTRFLYSITLNNTGLATFSGNTEFNGATNTVANIFTANGTTNLNGDIQTAGGLATDLIPKTDNSVDLGSDPTAAGKAWAEIHTRILKAYNVLTIQDGEFRHYPSSGTASFIVYKDNTGSGTAIKFNPNNVLSNDASIELATPTVVDPSSVTPTSGGVHALRIVPTELALFSASPKMPLAFGPNTAPTGGMNQYGIPIRNWHFRDDFMYHPTNFDETLINGDTQYNFNYRSSGGAGYQISVIPDKGMFLACQGSSNAELNAGERLPIKYSDWIMHGVVELQTTTQVKVYIGWKTTGGRKLYIDYEATTSESTWGHTFDNGTSAGGGNSGSLTPSGGGPLYFTLKQVDNTEWDVFMKNSQGVYSSGTSGFDVSSSVENWSPFVRIESTEALTKGVYVHYWEWYRQTTPRY